MGFTDTAALLAWRFLLLPLLWVLVCAPLRPRNDAVLGLGALIAVAPALLFWILAFWPRALLVAACVWALLASLSVLMMTDIPGATEVLVCFPGKLVGGRLCGTKPTTTVSAVAGAAAAGTGVVQAGAVVGSVAAAGTPTAAAAGSTGASQSASASAVAVAVAAPESPITLNVASVVIAPFAAALGTPSSEPSSVGYSLLLTVAPSVAAAATAAAGTNSSSHINGGFTVRSVVAAAVHFMMPQFVKNLLPVSAQGSAVSNGSGSSSAPVLSEVTVSVYCGDSRSPLAAIPLKLSASTSNSNSTRASAGASVHGVHSLRVVFTPDPVAPTLVIPKVSTIANTGASNNTTVLSLPPQRTLYLVANAVSSTGTGRSPSRVSAAPLSLRLPPLTAPARALGAPLYHEQRTVAARALEALAFAVAGGEGGWGAGVTSSSNNSNVNSSNNSNSNSMSTAAAADGVRASTHMTGTHVTVALDVPWGRLACLLCDDKTRTVALASFAVLSSLTAQRRVTVSRRGVMAAAVATAAAALVARRCAPAHVGQSANSAGSCSNSSNSNAAVAGASASANDESGLTSRYPQLLSLLPVLIPSAGAGAVAALQQQQQQSVRTSRFSTPLRTATTGITSNIANNNSKNNDAGVGAAVSRHESALGNGSGQSRGGSGSACRYLSTSSGLISVYDTTSNNVRIDSDSASSVADTETVHGVLFANAASAHSSAALVSPFSTDFAPFLLTPLPLANSAAVGANAVESSGLLVFGGVSTPLDAAGVSARVLSSVADMTLFRSVATTTPAANSDNRGGNASASAGVTGLPLTTNDIYLLLSIATSLSTLVPSHSAAQTDSDDLWLTATDFAAAGGLHVLLLGATAEPPVAAAARALARVAAAAAAAGAFVPPGAAPLGALIEAVTGTQLPQPQPQPQAQAQARAQEQLSPVSQLQLQNGARSNANVPENNAATAAAAAAAAAAASPTVTASTNAILPPAASPAAAATAAAAASQSAVSPVLASAPSATAAANGASTPSLLARPLPLSFGPAGAAMSVPMPAPPVFTPPALPTFASPLSFRPKATASITASTAAPAAPAASAASAAAAGMKASVDTVRGGANSAKDDDDEDDFEDDEDADGGIDQGA